MRNILFLFLHSDLLLHSDTLTRTIMWSLFFATADPYVEGVAGRRSAAPNNVRGECHKSKVEYTYTSLLPPGHVELCGLEQPLHQHCLSDSFPTLPPMWPAHVHVRSAVAVEASLTSWLSTRASLSSLLSSIHNHDTADCQTETAVCLSSSAIIPTLIPTQRR